MAAPSGGDPQGPAFHVLGGGDVGGHRKAVAQVAGFGQDLVALRSPAGTRKVASSPASVSVDETYTATGWAGS